MSENPPPSEDPTWPCPSCEWPINDGIVDDTPECPHGWVSLEGMSTADLKGLFAAGCDDLSLDPQYPQETPK